MGYYTTYSLKVTNEDNSVNGIIEELRNYSEYCRYSISQSGSSLESTKWYEHEKELREFSKFFPEVLFKLSGEGEESGDLWIEYYKNGKMQRCEPKITFDDFNPDLLE